MAAEEEEKQLTDILVFKLVSQATDLTLMFDGTTPDDSMFELLKNTLVNAVTLVKSACTETAQRFRIKTVGADRP